MRFCYQKDKEKSADAPANKAAQLKSVRALNAVPASFQSATPIVKLAGRCSAGSSCIGLPPAGGEDEVSAPANSPPRCIRGGQRKGASAQNCFMRLRARETSQNGGNDKRQRFYIFRHVKCTTGDFTQSQSQSPTRKRRLDGIPTAYGINAANSKTEDKSNNRFLFHKITSSTKSLTGSGSSH